MSLLIILISVSYFIVCFVSYSYLYKVKNLIGYHLGMNLAMSSSGVMGIAVGTVLGYAFPAHYTLITIAATVIAVIIGAIFGALVDYQTLLSGISSGLMAGVMGPMIGVVADLGLVTFTTILVYFTFGILCFSLRS
ncbi:hypothetical protein D8M04_15900 [Oceanobacillus piezotolerans]|uniref:Uncharacterized protein n=1 Tax=Oceanobacillus piezotolerans TaxID=2448030 RepID=A0A498D5Y2_9BACI|nr:hypothetical protein [Oceanobacillus piezotolerans]RLL42065.1 hypothetical protein D8M04_15900 [Oceanobacillus piezotolerans]